MKSGFIVSFHTCQFDSEECKINEIFQAKLYVICYVLCLSPPQQYTGGQEFLDPETWSWALYTGGSREQSWQKDFTSHISTHLWLGFTSPVAPCLRTVLLNTKILFSQKEGKE